MVRLAWQPLPLVRTHAYTEKRDCRERATQHPHRCAVRVRLSESRQARRAESHKPRQPTGGDRPIRVVLCATTRHPRIDHMLAHSPFLSSYPLFPFFLLYFFPLLFFDNISKSARPLFVPKPIYQRTDSQDGCIHIVSDTRHFPNTFLS